MEWSEPVIVLSIAPYGEGDLRAVVLTEAQGAWHGLARGGAARRGAAIWQEGNLVAARWVARLPEQLGSLTGELVHPAAALAMENPLALAVLRAACAVAAGALPEREPHPSAFLGLARLLAGIAIENAALPALVRFEVDLLRELGYGLDLSACALTGVTENLAFVSPRTGRAVAREAAGIWESRLLVLPAFLVGDAPADLAACRDGLALTGHFLARDAFGSRHAPLPQARLALYDLVSRFGNSS
ncbi:DNA repair protein RecO [Acidiphilium sp. AL]|uniref:DNA repair protein RecO n=1 Tax=Acidiphilium iwatense TaxID=768198 RepID=A0ABS9DR78_9PROT|nr:MULTISPECIES: DNA repair protein RecO [Acidiphilium]MCF3945172.1 DNA repair protein RecO [Acidiphilium iwatense]MCU4160155.1 DNA repair protein RecO [Acidiphilium sp. AL]